MAAVREGGAVPAAAPAPAYVDPGRAAQVIGQTRPAEEMEEVPVVKRQRVEKLAFGLYTEVDWLSLHPYPITLSVALPAFPSKPEWALDGTLLSVPDLPVNLPFSMLRDRIKKALGPGAGDLPISRMQLSYEGKVMSNQMTLAGVNLDEGDVVGLVLKKK